MPNDLSDNPLYIDTEGPTPILNNSFYPAQIRWVGATTAGHQCILQDKYGRTKWKSVAAGANNLESEQFTNRLTWEGLIVPTLDSGEVFITVV